jgi:hypothetical protein
MRILFFLPQTRHTPGFEWGLELIQRLLAAGDDVLVLVCNGEASSCEINLLHRYSVCHKCICKRAAGFELLDGTFKSVPFLKLTAKNRDEIAKLPSEFESLEALKRYTYEGWDVGMAVASSMISCTRDPHFDLRVHRETVANLLQSAVAAYRSIQHHLDESKYDRVYTFNGRTATYRSAFRAAQSRNIECHIYENGSTIHKLHQYIDHVPLDIPYTQGLIEAAWRDAPDTVERERIARTFYEKATKGQSMLNYIASQKSGLLPDGFDATLHNIAIYNSSEDELAAVGDEWKNPIYESQLSGLQQLQSSIAQLPENVRLYLRVHPHLRGVNNEFTRSLWALRNDRFIVIPADSPVSSYALLHSSKTVLTCGSTLGIEACYHGKPSVLAGKSYFWNLGAGYAPSCHAELLDLLSRPLAPKPVEPALKYGYFMETFGEPFKYFKAESYHQGTFKGQRLTYGRHWDYIWAGFEKLPVAGSWLNRRHVAKSRDLLTGS